MLYISNHFYTVSRFGSRHTSKSFLKFEDALKNYDQKCRTSNCTVMLEEYVESRKPHQWAEIYTNDPTVTNIKFRDVSKTTKRVPAPFGL